MTPLHRIVQEKRLFLLPLAVALAANAALYTLAVYPLTVRVASAERRAAAAAEALGAAEAAHAQAVATRDGKARADSDLRTFYREVLPDDLAGARRITYARLAALAEAANLRYERRSSVNEQDRDSSLARLRTTMVLAGEYPDVRQFIYALETAEEFVVIEDVSLVQRDQDLSALVLTLQVSTYYWVGPTDA